MALTASEQTQIKALITREGGIATLTTEIRALDVATKQATALATLAPAITATVQDWTALQTFIAQGNDTTLYSVMSAIASDAAAHDASRLGPLMAALYAAVKAHLSL